jgi:hypothetical protein
MGSHWKILQIADPRQAPCPTKETLHRNPTAVWPDGSDEVRFILTTYHILDMDNDVAESTLVDILDDASCARGVLEDTQSFLFLSAGRLDEEVRGACDLDLRVSWHAVRVEDLLKKIWDRQSRSGRHEGSPEHARLLRKRVSGRRRKILFASVKPAK